MVEHSGAAHLLRGVPGSRGLKRKSGKRTVFFGDVTTRCACSGRDPRPMGPRRQAVPGPSWSGRIQLPLVWPQVLDSDQVDNEVRRPTRLLGRPHNRSFRLSVVLIEVNISTFVVNASRRSPQRRSTRSLRLRIDRGGYANEEPSKRKLCSSRAGMNLLVIGRSAFTVIPSAYGAHIHRRRLRHQQGRCFLDPAAGWRTKSSLLSGWNQTVALTGWTAVAPHTGRAWG